MVHLISDGTLTLINRANIYIYIYIYIVCIHIWVCLFSNLLQYLKTTEAKLSSRFGLNQNCEVISFCFSCHQPPYPILTVSIWRDWQQKLQLLRQSWNLNVTKIAGINDERQSTFENSTDVFSYFDFTPPPLKWMSSIQLGNLISLLGSYPLYFTPWMLN